MPTTNMQNPEKINNNFIGKDILSLDQFDKKTIDTVFSTAKKMRDLVKSGKPSTILNGTVSTLVFYEPSSRTFGSFSGAIKRLGGQTIAIQNPSQVSSVAKGETLKDTIKTFENYSDAIVIRHPEAGTAQKAADAADIPIINAGDGVGEHPTQALLDLFTMYERFGKIDGLTILMAGDMKNGRTVHSLIRGLALYTNVTAYLLSPESLKLSPRDDKEFMSRGIKLIEITSEKDIPKNANVWYWTRVQKERFANPDDYYAVLNKFVVNKQFLETYGNKDMILMHPLPRVGEIAEDVDDDPRSVYLTTEMRNGMYIRMALMALALGKTN